MRHQTIQALGKQSDGISPANEQYPLLMKFLCALAHQGKVNVIAYQKHINLMSFEMLHQDKTHQTQCAEPLPSFVVYILALEWKQARCACETETSSHSSDSIQCFPHNLERAHGRSLPGRALSTLPISQHGSSMVFCTAFLY